MDSPPIHGRDCGWECDCGAIPPIERVRKRDPYRWNKLDWAWLAWMVAAILGSIADWHPFDVVACALGIITGMLSILLGEIRKAVE